MHNIVPKSLTDTELGQHMELLTKLLKEQVTDQIRMRGVQVKDEESEIIIRVPVDCIGDAYDCIHDGTMTEEYPYGIVGVDYMVLTFSESYEHATAYTSGSSINHL
jgi:hypothetical protein